MVLYGLYCVQICNLDWNTLTSAENNEPFNGFNTEQAYTQLSTKEMSFILYGSLL